MNPCDEIRSQVKAFVFEHFPVTQNRPLDDDQSLIESGIIDSMGVLELVTFIESDFEIVLSDEDVVSENFDSVTTIAKFIEEKLTIGSRG